jgi:serine/threonine protein kinase
VKLCPVCSTEFPYDVKFCPNDGATLRSASPMSDLVGQVVADRYHVVKKLGEGGMGQVYLAEHVKMGRRSAIKVMNPSMVHDPDAVARFNREASNASRITHPNVCAIYDFGETPEGLIYLAMEYIEGEPLTDLLHREGALKVPRAVHIFRQVADALQAAHDLGIVHRDLKPDNIMLTKTRGGADMVKVVDFGIAKAVGGDESGQKVTKTGLVVGTPEFMSPEQLSGDKLDGRSDLYSLALVFYKMLTGQLPFEADTVQETMIKRLTDEPAKLAALRPDLPFPPGLQEVLDNALARTPVDRYQTVSKFSQDVASVTGVSTATTAVPATRSDVTSDKTQLLDASATKAIPAKRAGAKAAPATRGAASEKKRSLVPMVGGVVAVLALGGGAWAVFGHKTPPANGAQRPADTTKQVTTVPHDTSKTQHASKPPNNTTNPGTSATATQHRVDPAKAADALDALTDLVDRDPAAARDSATVLYEAASVAKTDKAMAAFVIANAFWKLGNRPQGCTWIRRAQTLDPATPTFTTVATSQCQ